jgi:hypothetical protein
MPTNARSDRTHRHQPVDAAAARKKEPMSVYESGVVPSNGHSDVSAGTWSTNPTPDTTWSAATTASTARILTSIPPPHATGHAVALRW